MDLGRPVARHTIRRPHEAIELDTVVTRDEQPAAEEADEVRAEPTER